MPGRGGRIHWYYNSLMPTAAVFTVLMEEAIEELMEQATREVEEYAQANAPWEDQSGAARNGLTAEFENTGNVMRIVLYHTVDYGIWLETIQNGRFAIIQPTIEHMGPIVVGALAPFDIME